jgi:hypothetical protein
MLSSSLVRKRDHARGLRKAKTTQGAITRHKAPDSAAGTGALRDRVTPVRALPRWFLAACFACRCRRVQVVHIIKIRPELEVLHHL